MQLRLNTQPTLESYLSQQAWRGATLPYCPIDGAGCRPRRHGCYWRKFPCLTPVARFYCPRSRTTFSLLPDCLSSRYRGELFEFEQACVAADSGVDSLSICNTLRSVDSAVSITARSAARWVGRRCALMSIMLRALLGIAVEQVQGVRSATQFRARLCSAEVLVAMRAIVAADLNSLPPPLGFGPWPKRVRNAPNQAPHAMAPEPDAPSG